MCILSFGQPNDHAKEQLLRPVCVSTFNGVKHVEKLLNIALWHVNEVKFGKSIWASCSLRFELAHCPPPGSDINGWQLELMLWQKCLGELDNPHPI